MTTVHWITVSEALRVRIQTELSIQVERRYAAFLDKSKVKTPGKYIVIPSAMEQEAKRSIDLLTITVDVGFQIALPDPNKDYQDPLDNTGWFDEQATKVQKIWDLFGPEGPLREESFAEATFVRSSQPLLWQPQLIIETSIYTSVIRFDFRLED